MIKAADLQGVHRAPFSVALLAPRYWLTWFGLACARASLWLPWSLRLRLSRLFGALYYRTNGKRRRIADINLRLCFPHWTAVKRDAVIREHCALAAQGLFFTATIWWAGEATLDRWITIEGLEHYAAARDQGRPVLALQGHFVGLESGVLVSRHFPYVGFMKALKNPVLDWAMTRGRERFGGRVFDRAGGLRPLIRALRAGFGASYVADEDLGPRDSVYAPFFGVPAATLPTAGRLAGATGAVVIPCFAELLPDGRCAMWLEPPIAGLPTGDPVHDARLMNEAFERAVLRMPAQYMWTLKRFKTQFDHQSPYER
ncbi:MAG: lysophospholipid acyltransferase family protein [Gammaproteobacteria bacterium]|nr:lysophospholipid acyltransferase family protein [Gammaproteobacteria bacterium]